MRFHVLVKNWIRRMLNIHSPSAHCLGFGCWCQERKDLDMTVMHIVTFKHKDGSATQHLNVETERLALVFGEADWETITDAKVTASPVVNPSPCPACGKPFHGAKACWS